MKSKFLTFIVFLGIFILNSAYLEAQVDSTWTDCDCPIPTEEDGVCVLYSYVAGDSITVVTDTTWMPSECLALCWGYLPEQILGHCDREDVVDSTWTDCDCPIPTEEDGVCVLFTYVTGDSITVATDTTWMPSECLALCYGFTPEQILGHCDWEDVYGQDSTWTDCDCPEPTEEDGVCVTFTYFFGDSTNVVIDTTWMPSECLALCYGFTPEQILGQCDWEDVSDTTWINCDCPDPVEGEGVCVEFTYVLGDSVTVVTDTAWFESECLALCFGFTAEDLIYDCDGAEANSHFLSKNEELDISDEIITYPNPFDTEFTISSELVKNGIITVTSIDGRKIFSDRFDKIKTIDGNTFNPGIYIVTLTGNNVNITNRIVKMK